MLIIFNISFLFTNVESVFASPGLTVKWWRNFGQYAKTYIGPLSADVDGDGNLEVIVTGGTTDGGYDGTVTVLDGKTGNIKWQASPGGIGMHSPAEIADINKDGILEIIVSGHNPVVLFGNNGSVYWKNTAVSSYNLYSPVADIDADGYYEIFCSSGLGPWNGDDYFWVLSYDGKILRKNNGSWHPCWGGMTIGDANFDGKFELYQGDRCYGYDTSAPYTYGEHGVSCIDPYTLTRVWEDKDVTCSSHTPMLADVDKDGILDVVVAHQSGGLAVYNALTGSVLTTGGKYRKNLNLGFTSHSQPTICDIDGDGNLEIITCRSTQPKIWDLYDWKLDATLPIVCYEPPKVGDVTGDGKLDIISVTDSDIYVYSYDKTSQKYVEVDHVTLGAIGANAFTLVQDVDGDNYNELIVTSRSGQVICFDTPALAPTPRVRSDCQFYSERHCGVAEYVPPPGPLAPIISELSPADGATNVPITLSQLTFKLTDYQHDPINYTVKTNPDIGSASGINVRNGKITAPVSGLAHSTTYTWTVTATDGAYTTTKTFTFTTSDLPPWYNTDWQYRKTIIIDHTKVSGAQTDFPVLIDLTDPSLTSKAQQNGDDFLFTDQDNNKLDHHIEYYDSAAGHLIVWVKVPLLSSSADVTIYMYYGNPSCGSQQNPNAVWDASYKLVLHLNEQTSVHYDSTVNGNNGTPLNGVQQGMPAKIDGGDTFDGQNDYIEIPHSNTLAGYTEALTISFWVRIDDTSRRQTLLGKYNTATGQRGWFVDYNPKDRPTQPLGFYASWDGTNYREWYASFVPQAGVWYHITIVWTANAVPRFYVNGVQVATVGTATISQIYNNIGVPLLIGRCQYDNTRYFKGSIDEVTISNPARPVNWILTSYNNQLNPAAFYRLGAEEQFEEVYVLTVAVDGHGSVAIDPEKTAYKQGESVTLTAAPDYGYEFAGWTGDISSTDNPLTITITKNVAITANFTRKQYVINATVSGTGGTIAPSGLIPVYHGEDKTFTITPDTGYHILDVIVDSESQGPIETYTFQSVTANHTIIALFAPDEYTLTIEISPPGGGVVNVNKTAPYYYGDVVELTAVPTSGWSFAYWSDDLSGTQETAVLVMDGSKTVTAVFIQNQPPIILAYSPEDLALIISEGETLEFTQTSIDPEGQPLSYRWLLDGIEQATSQNWIYAPGYDAASIHIVTLVVSDGELSTSIEWQVTVINVNRPPQIEYYSPSDLEIEINEGQSIIFEHVSSDPDGDMLEYSWLLNGVLAAVSQNWTFITDYNSAGFYNITLTVTDGELTVKIQWNVNVLNVNRPPQINSPNPSTNPTILEGDTQEFSISPFDPDGEDLLIEWYVNSNLVKINATAYTFISNYNSAGTYIITVKVSDGPEQALHQWTLTVIDVPMLLVDSGFDESTNSEDLRANGAGQDWYESRGAFGGTGRSDLLTLDKSNVGGNTGNKAALKNYGIRNDTYLTQEFSTLYTGTFPVCFEISFDIYIDRIEVNANYNRTGHIYIGDDSVTTNAPTGQASERFVLLAFYDPTPGDTGNDLELRARTLNTADQSWSNTALWVQVATGLSYDTWYRIRIFVNVTRGTYDVYINGVLAKAGISKMNEYPSSNPIKYITFSADSDGRGDFYVDNVEAILIESYTGVYFVNAGTGSAGTGNSLVVSYPSGLQAGDLILLQVTVRDTSTVPTTPSGFSLLFGPDSTGTGRQWIYYKFATGSESDSLTISVGGSAVKMARMYAFRNVAPTNFVEDGGFTSGSGSTINAPTVTTSGDGRLAVAFVFVGYNNAVGSFTGESGGDWQETIPEYTTNLGSRGCIQLQTALIPSTGTISGGTYTMTASNSWGVRAFALKPAV
ncbi:MAG: DUF2341 domain-containing protein [Candidatus Bathyarchaeales archaeon]